MDPTPTHEPRYPTKPYSEQLYEVSATILESPDHGPQLCLGLILSSDPPQCGGPDVIGWSWDMVDGEKSARGTTWVGAYVQGTYDGERFTLVGRPGPPRPASSNDEYSYDFRPACAEPMPGDPSLSAVEREDDLEALRTDRIPGLAAIWNSDPGRPDNGNPDWGGPHILNVVVQPGFAQRATRQVREVWRGNLCVAERHQPLLKDLEEIHRRLGDVLSEPVLTSGTNAMRGVVHAMLVVVFEESQKKVDEAFGPGLVVLKGALTPVERR